MDLRNAASVLERRKLIETSLHLTLEAIGSSTLDDSVPSKRHCENMIGFTQVPIGVAGPLRFQQASGQVLDVYLPLATTEGALVASINRGCKAIFQSGGAVVSSEYVGPTRGPVFKVVGLQKQREFKKLLHDHFSEIRRVAQETSHHLHLTSYTTSSVGNYVYVRFVFDTQAAMGLNMITIATDAIALYIKEHFQFSCLALSGNFCVDKKPSWSNFLGKRGIAVWSEVTLTEEVLTHVLKTTAPKMYEVWLSKCMLGSIMSGSLGFNAQFANVIAALFLATGQDIAHVGEGSVGVTSAEVVEKDIHISVYLPDLMVGIVGGGTGLPTQKEALSLLGISGGDNCKLAEVIGGAVLAGEISLLSSLEEGSLARAHQRLGRGGVENKQINNSDKSTNK